MQDGDRDWSSNMTCSGRARQIGFTEFPPVSANNIRRRRNDWCAGCRRPGGKTLYLSAHASHIVGWPVADGRLLLADLNAHATQRRFVYSHTWRLGDLVIWDNRCTMHRGRPHDESSRAICGGRPHWTRVHAANEAA